MSVAAWSVRGSRSRALFWWVLALQCGRRIGGGRLEPKVPCRTVCGWSSNPGRFNTHSCRDNREVGVCCGEILGQITSIVRERD